MVIKKVWKLAQINKFKVSTRGHTLNFIQSYLKKHNRNDPLGSHIEQWHFLSKSHIRNNALKERKNQYNEISFTTEARDLGTVKCDVCQCPLRQHWLDKLDNDTNFCDCPEEAPFTKKKDQDTQNNKISSNSDKRRRKCARCWKRRKCYCQKSSDSSNWQSIMHIIINHTRKVHQENYTYIYIFTYMQFQYQLHLHKQFQEVYL